MGVREKVIENLMLYDDKFTLSPCWETKVNSVSLPYTDSSKFIKQLFNPFNCSPCYFD